jgi:hypothetical protein
MSPVAIVLLVAAAVLLVACEWPRLKKTARVADRAPRARTTRSPQSLRRFSRARRRRPKLQVVHSESEEFVRSVQQDLARLPTIDEHDVKR